MKINFVGNILGSDGYSNHCRGLFNALFQLNPDIKLDVPLAHGWETQVNDAELAALTKDNRIADITIAIMTPPFWRIAMGDNTKKFIGFCVWEGDKIPQYWLEYLYDPQVDQIWVPSQHTKDAIMNTISSKGDVVSEEFEKKIKIVPHGIDPSKFFDKPVERKSEDFTFLINKGWRGTTWDRGGVQYALRAFCEEFGKDEKVSLLLKLNPAYINPQMIGKSIDALKLPEDRPEIKLNYGNLTQVQLNDLYNESDCFVCPTRAEAFDLGSAEAMATGLPVITTNYGGQIEHMDKDCAWFCDYDMSVVTEDLQYEGVKWAIPNVQKLRELMREAFSQGVSTREKGKNAKKFISSWTWMHSAQMAVKFLEELK